MCNEAQVSHFRSNLKNILGSSQNNTVKVALLGTLKEQLLCSIKIAIKNQSSTRSHSYQDNK